MSHDPCGSAGMSSMDRGAVLMTGSTGIPDETGLRLALRIVSLGHVIVRGRDVFSDSGQPFPCALAPFLRELFAHGQVQLERKPDGEAPRVVITTAGEALLAELESGLPVEERRTPLMTDTLECPAIPTSTPEWRSPL